MDLKINSCDEDKNNLGIKVEGGLGDLKVTTPSDSDDEDLNTKVCPKEFDTLANFPSSLIKTSDTPVLGNVAVSNSENVQFGNNTHFHGPVVIKQIVQYKNGVQNDSYIKTDDEKGQPSESKPSRKSEVYSKKFTILRWQKIVLSAVGIVIVGVIFALAFLIKGKNTHSESSSPDLETESTNYTVVVGVCYDNISLIIFSTILVFLTIFLIFYPLLTTQICDFNNYGSYTPKGTISNASEYFENRMTKFVPKADGLLIAPDHLRIVSRTDWLAQPVENELDKIRQPVPWVIISHTATESCHTQSECVLRVRLIQMFHIESRRWDDIGYNFLVAGDGSAYFGRGWDYIGAHTLGYNKYSIGIAFIGTFNNEAPPKKQIEACEKLIQLGVKLGKLSKDYKLFAHRQLASTLSPGDKLFDIVKTWPQFVNDTSNISELIPKY